MPTKTFTTNVATSDAISNFGLDARCDLGYRVLSYSGSLGGGTLQVLTQVPDGGDIVPVADAKLNLAMVDDNTDPIKQFTFMSAGTIFVTLTGATAPNVKVTVS